MSSTTGLIRLQCPIQNYPWGRDGTDSIISNFAPEACAPGWTVEEQKPYAELWMGTHPHGPARLYDSPDTFLSEHLAASPILLGSVPSKFPSPGPVKEGKDERPASGQVPFLFKILTCKQALPLQIHPDKKLAEELHERDPQKSGDWNHKPEIAVALTPFLGFAGFQPLDTIQSTLATVPELKAFLSPLDSFNAFQRQPTNDSLRALVKEILSMQSKSSSYLETAKDALKTAVGLGSQPDVQGGDAMQPISDLLQRLQSQGAEAVFRDTSLSEEDKRKVALALGKMQKFYKGDPATIVAAFMMNLVELQPGEAMYVPADGCHAWLDGNIIELMANSDDVLNIGFVPEEEKDDVAVFMDAVTCKPAPGDSYRIPSHRWNLSDGAGADVYTVPAEEFSVYHTSATATQTTTIKPLNGPSIAIVVSAPSSAVVKHTAEGGPTQSNEVRKGQVYFIPAHTSVEYTAGVEVWCAFYDDQQTEQTGPMK